MVERPARNRGETVGDVEAGNQGNSLMQSWLVELLVCPVDGEVVRVAGDSLVCERCGRRFPVRDGIPVMIPEDAEIEQQF